MNVNVKGLSLSLDRSTIFGDCRGAAAVEFSLIAGFLLVAMLNAVDLATYVYQRMEVENAAQMGVQAAWQTCDLKKLPATNNCPGLSEAIGAAIQSTALGDAVKLHSDVAEGYYCLDQSGGLERVSDVSSKPTDCSATGKPSLQPGDYITVQVAFDYASIFKDLTVTRYLQSPIVHTAFLRLQ